jgi:hypothetical protein
MMKTGYFMLIFRRLRCTEEFCGLLAHMRPERGMNAMQNTLPLLVYWKGAAIV